MTGYLDAFVDPKFLAVFVGIALLAWVFYRRKKYKLPPGPFNWPIIGSSIAVLRSKHGKKLFRQFFDWGQKYGSIIRVKCAIGDLIVVNEIKEAMEVLVAKAADTSDRMEFHSLDYMTEKKDIIFSPYDNDVRKMRKVAGAALRNLLSGGRLETMVHASLEKGVMVFEEEGAMGPFDPNQSLTLLVYNVICAMCFNVNFDLDDEEFQNLYKAMTYASNTFSSGSFLVDVFPPARSLPHTPSFRQFLKSVEAEDDYISKQVQEHAERFDPDDVKDFIDEMLKVERETAEEEAKSGQRVVLDKTQYKQMVKDIFFAGTETTSSTLLNIVFLLAQYPDVQAKVQEEIDEVVGSSRFPANADKPRMPYCEAVMHECMRLLPTVPLGVPHKTSRDTKISGYDIPANKIIIINHYALHMDPKEWKNPETFDPAGHFLDENGELLPKPRSSFSFGAGRRVCIGETIAKPEIFIFYTALFQRFTFRFEDGHKSDLDDIQDLTWAILPTPYKIIAEKRQASD